MKEKWTADDGSSLAANELLFELPYCLRQRLTKRFLPFGRGRSRIGLPSGNGRTQ
jgi:hypothetical protein